jgi:hypothetical protein
MNVTPEVLEERLETAVYGLFDPDVLPHRDIYEAFPPNNPRTARGISINSTATLQSARMPNHACASLGSR